jgi:hypothetical protein
VRVAGPAVGPGRLAARDVAELANRLDQALKRIGQALCRGEPRGRRPRARDIEELCRLYLVSWSAGSAVAGFDLAEPPAKMAQFGRIGDHSLDHLIIGLAQLAAPDSAGMPLPDGFDVRVLETCAALGNLLDHGIGSIAFTEGSRAQRLTATYTAWTRDRIRSLVQREHVRWKVAETGYFPTSGQAVVLSATHVIVADHLAAALPPTEGSFWKSVPLEELAAEQRVSPIRNVSELDSIWSEGDVFDDALSELLEDRAQRRRIGKTGAP